jgi:hypothetical protein
MSTVSDNEEEQPGIRPIDGAHPVQLTDSTQVRKLIKTVFYFLENVTAKVVVCV